MIEIWDDYCGFVEFEDGDVEYPDSEEYDACFEPELYDEMRREQELYDELYADEIMATYEDDRLPIPGFDSINDKDCTLQKNAEDDDIPFKDDYDDYDQYLKKRIIY